MKNKKRQPSKKRNQVLLRVGLICIAFYGVISIVQLQTQIQEKQQEVNEMKQQIEQQQQQNQAVRKQVEEGISDEQIAAIAREQGYILPNERVFADSSSKWWCQPKRRVLRILKTEDKREGMVVGEILEGKVTGITKFGAFVSLPDDKSGMVHISEVANSFVNDIKEFLHEGDAVKVKVLQIDESGRINLSIKRAQEEPQRAERRTSRPRPAAAAPGGRKQQRDPSTLTFEDKLKMFMADSESRMADIRHNTDRKSGARRRK